jgi:hypothetical protein
MSGKFLCHFVGGDWILPLGEGVKLLCLISLSSTIRLSEVALSDKILSLYLLQQVVF